MPCKEQTLVHGWCGELGGPEDGRACDDTKTSAEFACRERFAMFGNACIWCCALRRDVSVTSCPMSLAELLTSTEQRAGQSRQSNYSTGAASSCLFRQNEQPLLCEVRNGDGLKGDSVCQPPAVFHSCGQLPPPRAYQLALPLLLRDYTMSSSRTLTSTLVRTALRPKTVRLPVNNRLASIRAHTAVMSTISEAITKDHRELEQYYNEIVNSADVDHQQRFGNQFTCKPNPARLLRVC